MVVTTKQNNNKKKGAKKVSLMAVQQKLKGAAELVMTAVQLGFSAQSGVLRTSTRSTPARSRLQQGARFDPLKSFRLFCLGVPTYASKLRLWLQTHAWCVRESRERKFAAESFESLCVPTCSRGTHPQRCCGCDPSSVVESQHSHGLAVW